MAGCFANFQKSVFVIANRIHMPTFQYVLRARELLTNVRSMVDPALLRVY